METWLIILVAVLGILFVIAIAQFSEDILLLLLWIPPIIVVGGAFLYLTGERELFTTLGTVLYFLNVLLMLPILNWLYHEIFDD